MTSKRKIIVTQMQDGTCVIEGTLSVYYDTASVDLVTKFINETETSTIEDLIMALLIKTLGGL